MAVNFNDGADERGDTVGANVGKVFTAEEAHIVFLRAEFLPHNPLQFLNVGGCKLLDVLDLVEHRQVAVLCKEVKHLLAVRYRSNEAGGDAAVGDVVINIYVKPVG